MLIKNDSNPVKCKKNVSARHIVENWQRKIDEKKKLAISKRHLSWSECSKRRRTQLFNQSFHLFIEMQGWYNKFRYWKQMYKSPPKGIVGQKEVHKRATRIIMMLLITYPTWYYTNWTFHWKHFCSRTRRHPCGCIGREIYC